MHRPGRDGPAAAEGRDQGCRQRPPASDRLPAEPAVMSKHRH